MQLGHFESARLQLEPLADSLTQDAPLSSGYHRITRLLAEIYLESKQYERAQSFASSCVKYLARFPDQADALFAERRETALILAAVHEGRGEWKQAAQVLQEVRNLDEARPAPDPVWQIDVLSRLGRASAKAGDPQTLDLATRQIDHIAAELDTRYGQHEVSLAAYDEAMSTIARFHFEQSRASEAARLWQRLLTIYASSDDFSRQAEIWSEIATIRESNTDKKDWIAALDRCVALWQSQVRRISSMETRNEQRLMIAEFQLARSQRKLGQAHDKDNKSAKSIESYRASLRTLETLRQTLASRGDKMTTSIDKDTVASSLNYEARGESQFIDSFSLAVLQELKTVRELMARLQKPSAARSDEHDVEISQQILALRSTLYLKDDPRIYRAQLQLGAAARHAGNFREAHPLLVAALEYWKAHFPNETLDLTQIAMLLSGVERELAWTSSDTHRKEWLSRAQARLTQISMSDTKHLESTSPKVLLTLKLNLGRLAFELGQMDQAVSIFQEAEQLARDKSGELRALEFQRAALTATLQPDRAEIVQNLIDIKTKSKRQKQPEAELDSLMARVGIHLASQQVDKAEVELHKAAAICPDGPSRLNLERNQAVTEFLKIQQSVDSAQGLNFDRIEEARSYWLSILATSSNGDAASRPQLQQARACYYLSRLRYLEWHAGRRRWLAVYTSPTLGRSASYEERRDKHELRCLQYEKDVERYNQDVEQHLDESKVTRAQASMDRDDVDPTADSLIERGKQLRIEYQSLKQLGKLLKDEQRAKSISQLQLAGRSARDLSQLLNEASVFAERSIGILQKSSTESIDNYDPNLHYMALSNWIEILYAQLVTNNWDAEDGPLSRDAYRLLLIKAIGALEQAAALVAHPAPTKLGTFADFQSFFRSFGENSPTATLRDNLEKHIQSQPDSAAPQAIDRLQKLGSHKAGGPG